MFSGDASNQIAIGGHSHKCADRIIALSQQLLSLVTLRLGDTTLNRKVIATIDRLLRRIFRRMDAKWQC